MYITKVKLENIRCFESVEIDFGGADAGPSGTSVLITGNNGTGKSSILRAIAMGLCDRDSAASLLRELEGDFVRKHDQENQQSGEAVIAIELIDEKKKTWKIKTKVKVEENSIVERVEQEYDNKKYSDKTFKNFLKFWDELFVTAYGAGLRTSGMAKFSDYFEPDAVYSLFKYDMSLQDPELAWRRLLAAEHKEKGSKKKIDKVIRGLLKHVLDWISVQKSRWSQMEFM